jgi:hypothetical protein
MSSINIFQQQDFTGGLNLRSDQFQLADNESPKMLNVEIDPRGGVFSRGGMQLINATPVIASGTWSPEKLTPFYGATPHVMLTTETKLYKSTGSNFSVLQWDNAGTPTDVTANSTHGPCLAVWGNTLYISTGSAATAGGYRWSTGNTYATPLSASGTNPNDWQPYTQTSPAGKIPQAEHLCVHANKMFAANTTEGGVAHPNRVRWSHEFIPDNWLEADYIDINAGGQGIQGMVVANGQLIIFKPNATFLLYGYDSSNFQIIELSSSLGCQNHHAICSTDTGVYFYSLGRGLFFTDGNSITDVFANARPLIDLGYLSTSSPDGISVSWVGGRVWLSLPYSTTGTIPTEPTINLVFDPTLGSYTMFQTTDGKGVLAGCDFRAAGNVPYRLMIHPTLPRVLNVDRYDTAKDNIAGTEAGFTSYYRTKWFDGGSYMQKKMFRRPDVVLKQAETTQAVNVRVYHNFDEADENWKREFNILQPNATTSLWDAVLWDTALWSSGEVSSIIKTGKNLGLAKTVQLQFNGPVGEPWGISSIGYKFNSRRVGG